MGRLFWKFFFIFIIAQMALAGGISLAVLQLNHGKFAPWKTSAQSEATRALDAASLMLERGGEASLQTLLEKWSSEPGSAVYAFGPDGHELLGRIRPAGAEAVSAGDMPGVARNERTVALADGRSFVIVVDERGGSNSPTADGPGNQGRPFGAAPPGFPMLPIVGSVLAGFLVAALLAWYVSKPIRSLRRAFEAAAEGNLDARVGDSLGRRRDELADLGRDFDRTAAQLKRLMEGQRRLLHDVSHELRSPLARLQAAVGLARQQPGNVEESMDRIERESERMDYLIDELLTLSRVGAGVDAGRQESVDIAELLTQVVQDVSFEQRGLSVPVTFESRIEDLAMSRVKGNAEMLHRVFENVVRNAARYTPPGTRIGIVGGHDPVRREVRVLVSDEGPGVPVADLETIFEPFFRGPTGRGASGHGLGLTIARRIIEAHGGSIGASNRTAGGLDVEIRLPA